MQRGLPSIRSKSGVYKPSTTVFATFFLSSTTLSFGIKMHTITVHGPSGLESLSKRIHNIENGLPADLKAPQKDTNHSNALLKRHDSEHMPLTYRCDLKKVINDLMRKMSARFISSKPKSGKRMKHELLL